MSETTEHPGISAKVAKYRRRRKQTFAYNHHLNLFGLKEFTASS